MQPHEKRVVDEWLELSTKVDKLKTFLEYDKSESINIYDKILLKQQLQHMSNYLDVLEKRIVRFGGGESCHTIIRLNKRT